MLRNKDSKSQEIRTLQLHTAAAAKLLQSCQTLCNPIDDSEIKQTSVSLSQDVTIATCNSNKSVWNVEK